MSAKKDDPIGVFDSGLGGISVLREAVRQLPHEKFLYYGDSANAPYGEKSVAEVQALTERAFLHLLNRGCKAVVLACNTATAAAAELLREKYPGFPLLGIEPALKPAAAPGGNILVLATPLTIREEKYRQLAAQYGHTAHILSLPCPGIPELVENGITEGEPVEQILRPLLAPYRDRHFDRVVLGCTHYPFVANSIRRVLGYPVQMVDGAAGTAAYLRVRLEKADLLRPTQLPGSVRFENSRPDKLPLMERLLAEH